MKSPTLAILLCFLIHAFSHLPAFGQVHDSTRTVMVPSAPAAIEFPYLTISADALRALIASPRFKRIVFNHYPEQSGQNIIMRLVGVKLSRGRDTIGEPLFNLLEVKKTISGNYTPLQPSGLYYLPQYELTARRLKKML